VQCCGLELQLLIPGDVCPPAARVSASRSAEDVPAIEQLGMLIQRDYMPILQLLSHAVRKCSQLASPCHFTSQNEVWWYHACGLLLPERYSEVRS
jgi:hypothetical protein